MDKKPNLISDLLKKVGVNKRIREHTEKEIQKRSLAKFLFALRCDHNLTQKQLAKKNNCTQSKISKLEAAYDNEITVQDLLNYAKGLNLQLEIGYRSKSVKIVDLIKYHAFRIKDYLETLAKLAKDDESLTPPILKFHEEALFNIVRFIAESGSKLKISEKKSHSIPMEDIHITPPFKMEKNRHLTNQST